MNPSTRRPSHVLVPAACAAALAAIVYLNALDNPFVYDDFRLIVENPSLLQAWDLQAVIVRDISRPLVNLSYALDTILWGRNPVGYHATNLLLHMLNVVLVFRMALCAAEDRQRQRGQLVGAAASPLVIAGAAAVLMAVHPMMTQAVGYISGRSEMIYSAPFLLAFLAGRQWMLGGGTRWLVACIGLWVAAILAKESAVMLPAVLLAYDWFVLDGDRAERRRRLLGLELPLVALALAMGAVRVATLVLVEYPTRGRIDWRVGMSAVDAFWQYLVMFFAPRNQSIFHAVPLVESLLAPRAIVGVAGLAALVALMWALRRVHSVSAFGLLWFALLLVPSSMLFVLGHGEPMAEHRAYLSAAGLFLMIGSAFGILWSRPGRPRLLAAVAAVIVIAQLSLQTVTRNAIWQDPVMLAGEAARLAPGHWVPRILLAEALRQNGRCPEAVPEYRAAIAIRASEEFPYTRLAGCLVQGGRIEEAEATLQQLRTLNPTSRSASMALGVVTLLSGRLDESRAHLRQAIAQGADPAPATLILAFAEGRASAIEHEQVCETLRSVAGNALRLDECLTDVPTRSP